jgi:hypothetical protein
MKAKPLKLIHGEGYVDAPVAEATHVKLNFPGPVGALHLPVIIKGIRDGTNCWTWNGDTEKPTLRPSVLTEGTERITDEEHAILMASGKVEPRSYRCHTWVNDGKAQFLDDCSHDLRGQTVDMLEVQP